MRPIQSISVLMPTYQGEVFLERVLEAVRAQEVPIPWDFTVVDSGSTDGTLAILERWAERFPVPFVVRHIEQVEFNHGDTRNWLACRSSGDLLVFLTQDAIPTTSEWLHRLASNFDDPRVGGAYSRNVARPDADLLTRVFSDNDIGYAPGRRETRITDEGEYARLSPYERRVLCNFNDVASAVRRELWELHPFPRTEFGEDHLMARALLEAGYTVVYDDRATVAHSHDYGPRELRARGRIDARFNAEWFDRICIASRADADVQVERQLELDRVALQEAGVEGPELSRELLRARDLRRAAFHGLFEGGRSKRRFPATKLLPRKELRILFVVHSFPPETWAGTEVYTLTLARELARLGHRCTILTRSPATEGGPEDFSLHGSEFEGLRVWRMVHRLEHRNLRESYDEPRAEAAFREVLRREEPDVVHFQHLIRLSAGLVHVAKELGLPTVLTCHDYWALCSRLQLIRPNGVRCEENMKAGCYLCVKERRLEHIPRLARLDRVAGPLLDVLGAGARRARKLIGRKRERWEELADLRARNEFVPAAFAAADLLIAPSRFLRGKLLESGAFDPNTFLYSDNGIRTDQLQTLVKRKDSEGRVRFGFVGTLAWYKGSEVLIDAMNRLAGTRAVLNVFGEFRPEEDAHHAALRKRASAGNVHFRGAFDNRRVSEVYAEIDVLVFPSVWFENSPITIHEAFSSCTPVVTSNIGGMAELVRDGVDGLHFDVGDAEALAGVLRRFIEEPDLLERLSRDFMPVKTAEENAREMEFRYRALCCRVRPARRR